MNEMVDRVGQLHSSPAVAFRILKVLENPDFEIGELERFLETDPALAGAVMRLANSSFSGLSKRIVSLRQAMMLLGARSLRLVVLTTGLVDRLTSGAPAEVCREYWRRSLSMAVAASRLAGRRDAFRSDEAYVAGLMADIGVLVLAQDDTSAYVDLCKRFAHGPELMEAERERYGFDHPSLGAHLLSRWQLPGALTAAVAQHHDDCLTDEGFQRVAFAGDLLAEVLWTPESPRMRLARSFFFSEYGFDTDAFLSFVLDCKDAIGENAEVLRAELPNGIDCEAIVARVRSQFVSEAIETAVECDSITAWLDRDFSCRPTCGDANAVAWIPEGLEAGLE